MCGFAARTFSVPAPCPALGRSVCWGHPGRPAPKPPHHPWHKGSPSTPTAKVPNRLQWSEPQEAETQTRSNNAEEMGKCQDRYVALSVCLTCVSSLLPSLSASFCNLQSTTDYELSTGSFSPRLFPSFHPACFRTPPHSWGRKASTDTSTGV